MADSEPKNARTQLVTSGTKLLMRDGYSATSVDQICQDAGVTKGAFFHHFKSKEELAQACLEQWDRQAAVMTSAAPFQEIKDPLKKLLACIDFVVEVFSNPSTPKSCLAGTTVQEVSETHPALRDAANACFVGVQDRFRQMLDAACKSEGKKLDTASLATLWITTLQGSLLVYKASQDPTVIRQNMQHFRQYIESLFRGPRGRAGKRQTS